MSKHTEIKTAKKKDAFLSGQSVLAQMLRMIFFGEHAGKQRN